MDHVSWWADQSDCQNPANKGFRARPKRPINVRYAELPRAFHYSRIRGSWVHYTFIALVSSHLPHSNCSSTKAPPLSKTFKMSSLSRTVVLRTQSQVWPTWLPKATTGTSLRAHANTSPMQPEHPLKPASNPQKRSAKSSESDLWVDIPKNSSRHWMPTLVYRKEGLTGFKDIEDKVGMPLARWRCHVRGSKRWKCRKRWTLNDTSSKEKQKEQGFPRFGIISICCVKGLGLEEQILEDEGEGMVLERGWTGWRSSNELEWPSPVLERHVGVTWGPERRHYNV